MLRKAFPVVMAVLAAVVTTAFGQESAPKLLPPLPVGVTSLAFDEFFVLPVGPRGLTLTEKLKSLDGKRVRILGYMVRQDEPLPNTLLLTEKPVTIEEHEGGFSDLPTAYVRVVVPSAKDKPVSYTPRPLLLTGVLSVGPHAEKDDTISLVRLTLENESKN